MSDLYNDFPSWGEEGEYPQIGFFFEGGDQVNEKHMDALWNGIETHIDNLNTGVRDRVRDLHGDVVLDQGLVASIGDGTREVDVTASTAGAYVDGQRTGSVSAATTTHTANADTSTRTDVVWLDTGGMVGKTEDATAVSDERMKVAEVDVAPDDTISDVRNYSRDHVQNVASEHAPSNPEPGDRWHDLTESRTKTRQSGAFHTIITEQDDLTISGGDGLKGGNTVDLVGGGTVSLDIEPADFSGHGVEDDGSDNIQIDDAAIGDGINGGSGTDLSVDVSDFGGHGIEDDGSNNLRIDASAIGVGLSGGDGTDISLDESVIKDGGAKEIDVQEFSGGDGSPGQLLQTDGTDAQWISPATVPQNGVLMWSGSISNIPAGYVLCDGNNGTPDLRDRFVVGAGGQYSVDATGGTDSHTLTQSELASHSHNVRGDTSGSLSSGQNPEIPDRFRSISSPTASTGGDSAHENRPPYYALAYIMKV